MKQRYRLFRRGKVYYAQDSLSGQQKSLRTTQREEAQRLLHAQSEAARNPLLNLAMARVYLTAHDPAMAKRVWEDVMTEFKLRGKESSRTRYERAFRHQAFNLIRQKPLLETGSEDFLRVIRAGGVFTSHCLRRMHNLALGLGWLVSSVLAPRLWPKVQSARRRGITETEQARIVAAEQNQERRQYYEMLWETGAAQTDGSNLSQDNVDWAGRTLSYFRLKTGEPARLRIGTNLEKLLRQLPQQGPFFPTLAAQENKDRAAEFRRRCRLLGIEGVSLHSYRYAWAERARTCAYPERWAQAALGHNSRAVHQAYAKGAHVVCPPLEDYESKIISLPRRDEPAGSQAGAVLDGAEAVAQSQ